MLNPEPPPPMKLTPPRHETTSSSALKRKKHRTPFALPPSAEVVDVESFTPISFRGTTKSSAISVEHYDAVSTPSHVIDLTDTDDDDVCILNFKPRIAKLQKVEGESSSNAAPFLCEFCVETKAASDSFSIPGCCHVYCNNCVALYVESKLQQNMVHIGCPVPGCRGLLEAHDCRAILPSGALDRWGKALCEAVISAEEKFYCPFADCSVLLIREGEDGDIRECECPNCRRLFCALCRVPWHHEISCEEFQNLNANEREMEDIMLMNLAKQMQWKRCPSCRFYVAKSQGCMYMKCRCGNAFCYSCGAPYVGSNHNCNYCAR
ncbi:E3 ubiquitin-protein ligase RNF144B [Cajanus cajan]|uniref:RBR-type E3 ubiquitin transferase n=1 Tax=Cajanus cajan TaxID=3821 RepID=A0A151QP68_CAJCA|nr:E3 ubiquitin-protein ligase RNF144B [Cajanus cajan]KYP32098.1 E3 ubiquitin-protein ligase RNF144B family [Cajanus cajan]